MDWTLLLVVRLTQLQQSSPQAQEVPVCAAAGSFDAILSGRKIPWDAALQDDSEGSEDEPEDDSSSTSELQQLVNSTETLITDLMQLSSTIRNLAPHNVFAQARSIDTSHFEAYDIQHVQGKYPLAAQFLVTRMGQAISRRRLYLRYREEHRAKL